MKWFGAGLLVDSNKTYKAGSAAGQPGQLDKFMRNYNLRPLITLLSTSYLSLAVFLIISLGRLPAKRIK